MKEFWRYNLCVKKEGEMPKETANIYTLTQISNQTSLFYGSFFYSPPQKPFQKKTAR